MVWVWCRKARRRVEVWGGRLEVRLGGMLMGDGGEVSEREEGGGRRELGS